MRIAKSALAAFGDQDFLTGFGHVGDQGFAILGKDLGADRHRDDHVFAACAGAVLAHAMLPPLGTEMLLVAEIDQGVDVLRRAHDDRATVAAVTAVGAAELDELLAPEADTAIAAVSGLYVDLGLIDELHRATRRRREPDGPLQANKGAAGLKRRFPK